jgi:hypothetical protein
MFHIKEIAMFASLPTQMVAATRSHLTSQLELWVSLNKKVLESTGKFVDLNLDAANQFLVNAATGSCWMSANQVQPGGNMLSHGYQAADIAWGTYAELAKLALARVDESNRKRNGTRI